MKMKKVLGILFTCALVAGLLPVMGLTVYADASAGNNAQENVTITYDLNGATVEDWQKEFWQEEFGGGTVELTPAEAAKTKSMTVPEEYIVFFSVTYPKYCEFVGYEITHAGGKKKATGGPGTELTDLDLTQGATIKLLWEERFYTITLHASTVDGEDMVDPIQITGVGSGTRYDEALRMLDESCDHYTSLFSIDGYSDANHYRYHKPLSEYLAIDDEIERKKAFEFDSVPHLFDVFRDMDIYYILTRPGGDTVELTVDAPVCGEETTTPWDSEKNDYDWYSQSNQPRVSVSDDEGYTIYQRLGKTPYSFWVLEDTDHPFEGSFSEDGVYYIRTSLAATMGYDLNPDVQVKVNGAELVDSSVNESGDYLNLTLKVSPKTPSGNVTDMIDKIPYPASAKDADAVKAARDAYDDLTDEQKALVEPAALKKLQTAEFSIARADARAKNVKLKSVKAKKGRTAQISWTKNANAAGYQLEYSTSRKFTKKTTNKSTVKSNKTVKKTVGKLKKGRTYYFRVRPYTKVYNGAAGKKVTVYGKWSGVKKCKAKK